MKNKIILLIVIAFALEAPAQITFQKLFSGYCYSMQQTMEGGYIITGSASGFGAFEDVFLVKTNANGDSLWTKHYGGSSTDLGRSVCQTMDGGYIITGQTGSFGVGSWDVYLIKTDSLGDTLWTKTFGGTNSDVGNAVLQTADSGYIIEGYTSSFGGYKVYLIKTDANGNALWSRTFGGTGNNYGYNIQQTSDGGFIIVGNTYFGAGGTDVYLIKTDANGNALWTKAIGGLFADVGYSVQQTTDGGYIVAGVTQSFGVGSTNVYLIKTDTSGNPIWSKTFGGTGYDAGQSIQQTMDGGYIITGYTFSFGAGDYDVYLIRTDTSGNLLWAKTFGGTDEDIGYSVQQITNGEYMIAGFSRSFGPNNYDFYLIKTDVNGNNGCNEGNTSTTVTTPATQVMSPATIVSSPATIVTTPATIVGSSGTASILCATVGINEITTGNSLAISPNPFFAATKISFSLSHSENLSVRLIDVNGRLVSALADKFFEEGDHEIVWSAEKENAGVYFLQFQTVENFETMKLIVTR